MPSSLCVKINCEIYIWWCPVTALRDLNVSMDRSATAIPPIIFLQVLHMAFPRFAEKGEGGGYVQQVS